MNHEIINLNDLFNPLIHSRMKQACVFICESLNHSLSQLVQKHIHSENKNNTVVYFSEMQQQCDRLELFSLTEHK